MSVETEAAAEECVCIGCNSIIDRCCFCEREDCDCAVCYLCLVTTLGESRSHPHDHGG